MTDGDAGRRPIEDEEGANAIRPSEEARGGMGARWGAAGMPLERSKDFKNSTRRLVRPAPTPSAARSWRSSSSRSSASR